ncbi:MAG: hypothetical protein EPN56_08010 [Rhodanobacter sp.]|nr:MAG: hypothetical protein EPN78_07850 [Rhodanobacter sp.]TAM11070.1 MAG: hypothetical protein EPN66_08760 [Rhodanobacter sp.]TAM35531.1 MAG: hypothetical protein EPN56_08010 [Rhodanobacter sp.]
MHIDLPAALRERLHAIRWFALAAVSALIAGGLIAAVIARAPTQPLVWMVAFLVLVTGVAQMVLALGQGLLPEHLPSARWRAGEWWLFNLGNLGVIVGTLRTQPLCVTVGTALFIASLVAFYLGVRGGKAGLLLHAFRTVLVVVCAGACVGLALSLGGLRV